MSPVVLKGLKGSSPLEFMAALGALRIVRKTNSSAALGFLADGSLHPFITGIDPTVDLPALVAGDAAPPVEDQPWWVKYEKQEKKGTKIVADLKAPPSAFGTILRTCVERWSKGDVDAAAYVAAFGTSVAVDGKGNTKPTAFHFTAANQQFLDQVDKIRASVTLEWAAQSLFHGRVARPGSNLRWDPSAERNWALMANNPVDEKTSVDAPAEWLAFRGLPLFPTFPQGTRIVTTTVSGRGDTMTMTWPLWSAPASLETVRSLINMDWTRPSGGKRARGVFGVCTSAIRRTSQGFGNLGPAAITP